MFFPVLKGKSRTERKPDPERISVPNIRRRKLINFEKVSIQ